MGRAPLWNLQVYHRPMREHKPARERGGADGGLVGSLTASRLRVLARTGVTARAAARTPGAVVAGARPIGTRAGAALALRRAALVAPPARRALRALRRAVRTVGGAIPRTSGGRGRRNRRPILVTDRSRSRIDDRRRMSSGCVIHVPTI
jgi:hypothetical protein